MKKKIFLFFRIVFGVFQKYSYWKRRIVRFQIISYFFFQIASGVERRTRPGRVVFAIGPRCVSRCGLARETPEKPSSRTRNLGIMLFVLFAPRGRPPTRKTYFIATVIVVNACARGAGRRRVYFIVEWLIRTGEYFVCPSYATGTARLYRRQQCRPSGLRVNRYDKWVCAQTTFTGGRWKCAETQITAGPCRETV